MASFFRGINGRIRSNPTLSYVCSTHFWGPVSNFGIPIAAVLDTQKDAELISGKMTGALVVYSLTFMRYALAVTPWNPLLFACHFVNEGAQLTQGYRYLQYWHNGGRESQLARQAKEGVSKVADKAESATERAREMIEKGKEKVGGK